MGRKEQGRVATPSDFWSFTSYDIRRISFKFSNCKMDRFKMTSLWSWKVLFSLLTSYPLLKDYLRTKLSYNDYSFYFYNWAATTSWVIAPWWFCVSLWRICITFVWPSGSQKLPSPSSRSERHLHFSSIRLCLALLFIISILENFSQSKKLSEIKPPLLVICLIIVCCLHLKTKIEILFFPIYWP